MTRRTLLSMIAACVLAVVMLCGAGTARAQCSTPCTFHMVVCNFVPAACFPMPITTQWNMGGTVINQTDNITGPGLKSYAQPGGCPPEGTINWASPDGGITTITPGTTVVYTFPAPCSLTVCITVFVDAAGCVFVRICPVCP
jgi:hypothetical protein